MGVFYVNSATGSDANDGSESSPWQSWDHAFANLPADESHRVILTGDFSPTTTVTTTILGYTPTGSTRLFVEGSGTDFNSTSLPNVNSSVTIFSAVPYLSCSRLRLTGSGDLLFRCHGSTVSYCRRTSTGMLSFDCRPGSVFRCVSESGSSGIVMRSWGGDQVSNYGVESYSSAFLLTAADTTTSHAKLYFSSYAFSPYGDGQVFKSSLVRATLGNLQNRSSTNFTYDGCVFVNCDFSTHLPELIANSAFFNCTLGNVNNLNCVTLTEAPYSDPANGDWTLSDEMQSLVINGDTPGAVQPTGASSPISNYSPFRPPVYGV